MKIEKTSLVMYTGTGGLNPEMEIRRQTPVDPLEVDSLILEVTQVVGIFVVTFMALAKWFM